MSDENVHPVQRMFEAFNTGDLSRADEFISDDYLNHEALDNNDGDGDLALPTCYGKVCIKNKLIREESFYASNASCHLSGILRWSVK
jgi:hypothetical protein